VPLSPSDHACCTSSSPVPGTRPWCSCSAMSRPGWSRPWPGWPPRTTTGQARHRAIPNAAGKPGTGISCPATTGRRCASLASRLGSGSARRYGRSCRISASTAWPPCPPGCPARPGRSITMGIRRAIEGCCRWTCYEPWSGRFALRSQRGHEHCVRIADRPSPGRASWLGTATLLAGLGSMIILSATGGEVAIRYPRSGTRATPRRRTGSSATPLCWRSGWPQRGPSWSGRPRRCCMH